MFSWQERLCGSVALRSANPDGGSIKSIKEMLDSNEVMSCGGGFYPVNLNRANMTTFRSNFILPTKKYSVLVFKKDGNAVIYSEEDEVVTPPPIPALKNQFDAEN